MISRDDDRRRIIHSRQNPQVKQARRLARAPQEARREGCFLADGIRIVREALAAGLPCRDLFCVHDDPDAASLANEAAHRGISATRTTYKVIEAISVLSTPQGAVGLFDRPAGNPRSILGAAGSSRSPVVALLHRLQDPANAGSLVRTALAAGIDGLFATEGTVDLFHPRAVRGAMGACFHLPIATDLPPAEIWELLQQGGYRLVGLDPKGATSLESLPLDQPTAILLGREGSGVETEARLHCGITARIPMAGDVDSLGVAAAGAIAFYALTSAREKRA